MNDNMRFRVLPERLAPRNPKRKMQTLILSRKAQLWFMYHDIDLDFLQQFEERKRDYLLAKTEQNINNITALEIEHALRHGEALPDRTPRKRIKY